MNIMESNSLLNNFWREKILLVSDIYPNPYMQAQAEWMQVFFLEEKRSDVPKQTTYLCGKVSLTHIENNRRPESVHIGRNDAAHTEDMQDGSGN